MKTFLRVFAVHLKFIYSSIFMQKDELFEFCYYCLHVVSKENDRKQFNYRVSAEG